MHAMSARAVWPRVLLALVLGAGTIPVTAQPAHQHLRIIAPAAPGGGWDQTARVMQQVLQTTGSVRTTSVENINGAAGTIGLARFVSAERGSGDAVLLSGLIMLAAIATYRSPLTLDDVTPIARLTGEYEVIVVPRASPFRSLSDLIRAFKERPEAISWGGGSAGGTDQILAGLVADAVGVSPRRVNYIAFSGGGESLAAIVGGQVSVGVNGLAEFGPQIETGAVRVLGISSAQRLPTLDAPTLREQGIDVELENWRSVVAPPGISTADRQRLEATIDRMVHSAAWRDALTRYRWNDRYLAGGAFSRFVEDEKARVYAILRKLGTGRPESNTAASAGSYPLLVLTGLVVCGIAAAFAALRSARVSALESAGPKWRALALIAGGIALDLLLIERAGFVPASAALFWLTARAFDASRPARDALFGLAVSIAAYLLFARLLQLPLPSGVLAGWV
jgi:putative tricarboxylic transport membrane protein